MKLKGLLTKGRCSEASNAVRSAELRSAIAYYEEARPGIGRRFLQQVRGMLADIRRAPERYAKRRARGIKEELRSVVLARFPYEIVFYCEPGEIVVVAWLTQSVGQGTGASDWILIDRRLTFV